MRKFLASLLVVTLLSGCTTLASKEAAVFCQSADFVTTVVAIKGGAVEANPVGAAFFKRAGFAGLLGLKLLMIYLLLTYHDDIPEPVRAAVNGVTCAAAASNVGIITGQ